MTGKQRAYLRSLANGLDTILTVGKGGLTENVIQQADEALTARELIKGRVLETAMMTAAETARRYLLLRDELRGLEISLWMDALDKLAEKSRLIRQDYEEVSARLEEEKAGVEALYEESERCTEGIRQADEQAEALREEISRQEKEAVSLQSQAAALGAEEQNNLGSLARLEEEQTRQQERESELTDKLREREDRLSALEKQLEDVQARQRVLFSDSSAAASAVGAASDKLDALLRRAAAEDNAASAEDARREALRTSIAGLEARRKESSADLAQRRERLMAPTIT